MPTETIQDANLGSASSAESVQDANVSTGAKGQQSPADKTGEDNGEKPTKSFRDVAHEFMEKYKTNGDEVAAKETPAEGQSKESGSNLEPNPEAKPEEKVSQEKKEQTPPDQTKTDDSKLPFHNHPRFKKLVEERNTFEAQVREAQPLMEAGKRMQTVEQYCQTNGIVPQDYDNSLKIAALVNKDPKQAITVLESLVQNLKVQQGVSLPTDLQTRVDEGKLSLADAQELTQARLKEQRLTGQVQQSQQQSKMNLEQQLTKSVNSWITTKMGSDPSFKPSQDNGFGKFEQVQDRIEALTKVESPRTIEDLVKIMDKAYAQIHGFIEKTIPKPAQRRPLSPKNSVKEKEQVIDIRKPGWARQIGRDLLASR